MSIEQALIARAKPQLLTARLQNILQGEFNKGCRPDIVTTPVALEPSYSPFTKTPESMTGPDECDFIIEPTPPGCELVRAQIWISPEEEFGWLKSELFIKSLSSVSHRVAFEIIGNKEKIQMRLLLHQRDLPLIQTAFRGQFTRCELSYKSNDPFGKLAPDLWNDAIFLDYFPPPPYSELLTRPDELKVSTYPMLIAALMEIESPAIGFYQALMQPVAPVHNWHQNVQELLDILYSQKLVNGLQGQQRHLQQAPSGDLRQMVLEVETKAHNDKPFFCAAIRLGVVSAGKHGPFHLMALSTFANLFQHGGRPLNYVTEAEHKKVLSPKNIIDMFTVGSVYRPGFLVNSSELAGFIHIPPADLLEHRQPPVDFLTTLPLRNDNLSTGTPIGTCEYAGVESQVCIPSETRTRSTHLISKSGQGKSTTMSHMILDDIEKGCGVAVLDPHGDLVEDLIYLIKEEHVERTIYFNPGHPDYVPLWNPLKRNPGQSLSRTAENLVAAIKAVVTGWGDRLEHLLRNGLHGLLPLPQSTLSDLSNLLRKGSAESDRLSKAILDVVDNESIYQFWKEDFSRYSDEALGPPKHKLSKLLASDTVSLMLSQPENLIDFRHIMDKGMILLVNLSTIGPEIREILGCFMLSLLHITALGRSDIARSARKQFHVHVDEAHRFITDSLEDLIAETRKFGVGLTIAHQYFSQFGTKKIDALSSVGTTIIMNVDTKDARYLTKDLQTKVKYEDLIKLEVTEAIARIGTDIVKIKKPGPLSIPEHNFKEAIIKRSHQLYYKPANMIKDQLRRKNRRWDQPFSSLGNDTYKNLGEFVYEEF